LMSWSQKPPDSKVFRGHNSSDEGYQSDPFNPRPLGLKPCLSFPPHVFHLWLWNKMYLFSNNEMKSSDLHLIMFYSLMFFTLLILFDYAKKGENWK
jgi:hypothetical protein